MACVSLAYIFVVLHLECARLCARDDRLHCNKSNIILIARNVAIVYTTAAAQPLSRAPNPHLCCAQSVFSDAAQAHN